MRIDVITIFPEYLDAAAGIVAGQGDRRRRHRARRPRSARLDHRPAPHGGRLAVRRRSRHGHASRTCGVARWTRSPVPSNHSRRADAGRANRSPRPSPPTWPAPAIWCSPAVATRASTSGWSTTPRGRMTVRELSIGDYVLAGGEAAVLVMVEAVARLLPGVLGNPTAPVTTPSASPGRACSRHRPTPGRRPIGA